MARYTTSGDKNSFAALNAELEKIASAQEDFLSRTGEAPNQLEEDIDANGSRILNLPAPASSGEPVRLEDVAGLEAFDPSLYVLKTELSEFTSVTTSELISIGTFPTAGDVVRTTGYTSEGDGGEATWIATGNTITASSEPSDTGAPSLSDSLGNEYVLSYQDEINVAALGAKDDLSVDSTNAINAALAGFDTKGGVVKLPSNFRIKVSSLVIPANVTLTAGHVYRDQDEGATVAYDSFWGGLFCTGITLGHGSAVTNMAIVQSNLINASRPTTEAEANTLVGAFTGTALTLSGTGTTVQDLMILGFATAVLDSGNRHKITNVRFDCTSGITIGGGSDVSRISHCHAWPYLTAEMSLPLAVNYRSGTAYLIRNNADSYSIDHCYCFGYEVGYRTLGQSGQVVQSPQISYCRADSGEIGGSGTSIGFDIGAYSAQVTLSFNQSSNCDILGKVSTQGADTGGGERLNNVNFVGGVWMEPASKFFQIDNGYCTFTDLSLAKESTSTTCFDWNTSDGGAITQCKFEEMYETSGDGLIFDPANTTVSANVKRQFNKQATNIHADNRMQDSQPSTQAFGAAVGITPDGTGRVNIPHGLGRTPSWFMAQIRGDTGTACNVISSDITNIVVQLWDKSSGSDVTTGTHNILWEVKDFD